MWHSVIVWDAVSTNIKGFNVVLFCSFTSFVGVRFQNFLHWIYFQHRPLQSLFIYIQTVQLNLKLCQFYNKFYVQPKDWKVLMFGK